MLRYDKLTVKAQEALQAAQDIAEKSGQQQLEPLHLLAALVAQQDGVVPPLLEPPGRAAGNPFGRKSTTQIARLPKVSGVSQQYLSEATNKVLEAAFDEAEKFKDEYVSAEHILLAIAAPPNRSGGAIAGAPWSFARSHFAGARRGARQPPRNLADAGIDLPRARTVCARPDRTGPARQARSGDRPRRGNSPRDADPRAAHQEQSGADRRAGRRQDRRGRGPGAAHRRRRRARSAQAQAHRGAGPWPRWSPAPSIAANSKIA